MFHNEEVQSEIVEMLERNGFKMSRILYPLDGEIIPDVIISTKDDGPSWFGDLSKSDIQVIETLAKEKNYHLILQSSTNFGWKLELN